LGRKEGRTARELRMQAKLDKKKSTRECGGREECLERGKGKKEREEKVKKREK